jgi:hypothetical protein
VPRQPFVPKYKGKHFCFDNRGLEARPDFAALIGQSIAEWSRVEHEMAMVMAALLGSNPEPGVALFTTLRNARAQRDAMSAVGSVVLQDDKVLLFESVLDVYAAVGKLRHDLAHGVFGWSFDEPDLLLWVKSSDLANYEAEAWFRFKQSPPERAVHNHDRLEGLIFYYRDQDLREILSEIEACKSITFSFYGCLRHNWQPTSEEYLQLCSEPHISQALDRLRQGKKSAP